MPTVMSRSCSSAMMAASAIFQVRKYAAMTMATSTRNTSRPVRALVDTDLPHEGPMNEAVTLSTGTA